MNVGTISLQTASLEYARRAVDGDLRENREEDPLRRSAEEQEDTLSISDRARELFETQSEEDDPEQDQLEQRDREVRAHERAHAAAAGDLAVGGPTYTYQTGPDGKRYAVGGEVKIQLREGRTPEETVRLMQRAQRAANAPANPSPQDRAVAAEAGRIAAEARREMQTEDDEESPVKPRVDVTA